jgi:PAS domain S-box-containing protein
MGIDALRLLHRLSSDPKSAGDALKLLHELQVHQVELDLQNEEITDNEHELVADLERYQLLYDCAPFSYLLIEPEGLVIQGNLAAGGLLGVRRDELGGQRIDRFLTPESRPRLHDLLRRVMASGARSSCLVQVQSGAGDPAPLQLFASILPGQAIVLLACCENASAG